MSPSHGAVNLIAFPGAPNLPVFAALEHGYFSDAGVQVQLETTPSSTYQIEHLIDGSFEIAATAFDNVVAYQEGQGAVQLDEPVDLVAFMGATQIELSLVVAPEVESYADLRGRSLALDALATGFAFVLYHMLERGGLSVDDCVLAPVGATPRRWESVASGEHAGTLTIEPFTSLAVAKGFRVLQSSLDTLDSYQGGVFSACRSWAADNAESVVGFVRGYLKGLEWTLDPLNTAAARALLLEKMPVINPRVADAVMGKLLDPRTGLTPSAEFIDAGIDTVLELRGRYGAASKGLENADRYIDRRYLRRARDSA